MKKILFLLLVLRASPAGWAQTNLNSPSPPAHEIGLHSEHFSYDGNAHQLVYDGNVVVTNWQGRFTCGRLTINLPPDGGNPTNAVADTNVNLTYIDNKGQTNHLISDKGIYTYSVLGSITNETITFPHATNIGPTFWVSGEPLVWDNISNKLSGSNIITHVKVPNQTNTTHQLFY